MGKVYDQIGLVKANIGNVQTALSNGDHKAAIRNWKLAKTAYEVYESAKKSMSGKTKLSRSRQTKLNDMAAFESAYKEFKKSWGDQLDELDQMVKEAANKQLQEQFRIAREEVSAYVGQIAKAVATFDSTYDDILQKTAVFCEVVDKEFNEGKPKLIVAGNARKLKKRINQVLKNANVPKYLNVVTRSSKIMSQEAVKLAKLKLDPRDKSPDATTVKNERNRVRKSITSAMKKGQNVVASLNGWTTYVQETEKLIDKEEERLLEMEGAEGR